MGSVMKIGIITIGNELLSGFTIDRNSAWIGQRLLEIGLKVHVKKTIADDADMITKSLDELSNAKKELTTLGIQINGMSDHTISQSIYISDPDGNEVELYVDDPNVDWENEPNLVMSPIKPLFLND